MSIPASRAMRILQVGRVPIVAHFVSMQSGRSADGGGVASDIFSPIPTDRLDLKSAVPLEGVGSDSRLARARCSFNPPAVKRDRSVGLHRKAEGRTPTHYEWITAIFRAKSRLAVLGGCLGTSRQGKTYNA